MILIKKLLQERASSDVLYHFTKLNNLYGILKTNEFQLNSSLSISPEEYKLSNNKLYYLSTSRTPINYYIKNNFKINTAILVLDGNKLNNKYKIKPVDYFSALSVNDKELSESEDRILTNDPEIPNAKSYIKEIHIYYEQTKYIIELINKIILITNNIPIYFYDYENYYKTLNKNKSIKFVDIVNPDIDDSIITLKNKISEYSINSINDFFNLYLNINKVKNSILKEFIIDTKKFFKFNVDDKKIFKISLRFLLEYIIEHYKSRHETKYFTELLKKHHLSFNDFVHEIIFNIKGIK